MEPWARAGDVLFPVQRNTGIRLVSHAGILCWVRNGTRLLLTSKTPVSVEWCAPALGQQHLFDETIVFPDGTHKIFSDYVESLVWTGFWLYVMFVPQDMNFRSVELPGPRWTAFDPDVGMSRVVPRG